MRYYFKVISTSHFKKEVKKDRIKNVPYILSCCKETKESKKDGEVGTLEYRDIVIKYTIREKRLILITASRRKR